MGRELRIQFPNAFYHVMAHGNGFQWIYKNNSHLEIFKEVLKNVVIKYHVKIHAVVLMRNHYHILIETPYPNLVQSIKALNHGFSYKFNKLLNRKGSVFKDRYKAILIEKESYYYSVLRYICQNPIRKNLVHHCEEYKGSYLHWLKNGEFHNYIYLDNIKEYFSKQGEWYNNFIMWINQDLEINPFLKTKYRYLLGNQNWIERIHKKRTNNKELMFKKRKKYYNVQIDKNNLNKELDNINNNEVINIKIYIYSKYSELNHYEISNILRLKSEYVVRQRLYRYKKLLKSNNTKYIWLKKVEKKILNF